MSYAHKLKYAGSDPFEPEQERLPYKIAEQLEQDTTYQRLAQVRWLTRAAVLDELEDVDRPVAQSAHDALVASEETVDAYVSWWLAGNIEWLHEEVATAQQCLDAVRAYNIGDSQVSDSVQERILADAQEGNDVE
jgi:hypothetical protein